MRIGAWAVVAGLVLSGAGNGYALHRHAENAPVAVSGRVTLGVLQGGEPALASVVRTVDPGGTAAGALSRDFASTWLVANLSWSVRLRSGCHLEVSMTYPPGAKWEGSAGTDTAPGGPNGTTLLLYGQRGSTGARVLFELADTTLLTDRSDVLAQVKTSAVARCPNVVRGRAELASMLDPLLAKVTPLPNPGELDPAMPGSFGSMLIAARGTGSQVVGYEDPDPRWRTLTYRWSCDGPGTIALSLDGRPHQASSGCDGHAIYAATFDYRPSGPLRLSITAPAGLRWWVAIFGR